MPEKKTIERARRAVRKGKKPSTAAGEFVREDSAHVRQGKHGARSGKQVIAIGLAKARRAGLPLAPPPEGEARSETRRSAKRDLAAGRAARTGQARGASPRDGSSTAKTARRSRAASAALVREGRAAASRRSLSRQAKPASAGRPARKSKR